MRLSSMPDEGTEAELVLLRTKLEVRTWFLRVSLMFNMGFFIWFITEVMSQVMSS